jgi:glycolate oxidase iron-sulfur subunit
MKKLSDYAEQINKCSKCGKCQEVCPIYKLTGNDCAVSRGKFVMLNGVLKGDLKLSKTINKYLDMCLKCGKCKDFCPSDIDVCEIFSVAKSEYVKDTF